MSVLGKVLIVLNLLAAGAFAYLTLENWKLRQEITWRELDNAVKLGGIPIEAAKDAQSGEGYVAFPLHLKPGVDIETIPQASLEKLIPKGDSELGGETVANQTDEVSRLLKKVQANIAAKAVGPQAPLEKVTETRRYLLNIAKSGAERDGITALLQMFVSYDPAQPFLTTPLRRDIPYVGRTSSQVAALKALFETTELGDPQAITPPEVQTKRIEATRLAIKNFIKGEAAHGVVDADAKVKLRDTTIEAAFRQGAGDQEKNNIIAEATANPAFKHLADLALNPLSTKANITAAQASLLAYITAGNLTTQETAALTAVVNVIAPPVGTTAATMQTTVDTAATNLLEQKFQEAILPAATKTTATGNPLLEKGRRIAHLLYHIDAHRHTSADAKVVGDRKEWHQRVVTIIGMQEYVRAAETQAREYNEASQRLLSTIADEEAAFRSEYEGLVQYCQSLHGQWKSLSAQLEQQQNVEKVNLMLLTERQTEFDNLVNTYAEAQDRTKLAQDKLRQVQEKKFQILKDLRDAQQKLLELESDLRRLELGK